MMPRKPAIIGLAILFSLLPAWKASTALPAPVQAEPADKKLARLLIKRSKLRTKPSSYDFDGAIRDAEEAFHYDRSLETDRHVVLAKADLGKARMTASDATKQDLVDQSIKHCEDAVQLRREDIPSKVAILLVRAAARVDHANCVRDETFQKQKSDLTQAINDAQEAEAELQKLPQANSNTVLDGLIEANLTKGNAYEDLAWICHEDPLENFCRAIRAFEQADHQDLSGRAKVGIGRCYYRIGVQELFFKDAFQSRAMIDLGIKNEQNAKTKAATELSASNASEPSDACWAEYCLADLSQGMGDYAVVDNHYDRMMQLAGADLMTLASYRYLHAQSYLDRWQRFANNGESAKANVAWQEAQKLLRLIKACTAPAVPDAFDAYKRGVLLEAEMNRWGGDLDAALKVLDGEIAAAQKFSTGHALLLHARGRILEAMGARSRKRQEWHVAHLAFEKAVADFETEIELVYMRDQLLSAHLQAAQARASAYQVCLNDQNPGGGLPAAEALYFAKTIKHLQAVDRLWPTDSDSVDKLKTADKAKAVNDCQRRPRATAEFYQPYYEVAFMFKDKADKIEAKYPGAVPLTKEDVESECRWTMNLETLDPSSISNIEILKGRLRKVALLAPAP